MSVYVCVYVRASMCMWVQMPVEAKNIKFLEPVVRRGYERYNMDTGD